MGQLRSKGRPSNSREPNYKDGSPGMRGSDWEQQRRESRASSSGGCDPGRQRVSNFGFKMDSARKFGGSKTKGGNALWGEGVQL